MRTKRTKRQKKGPTEHKTRKKNKNMHAKNTEEPKK